MQNLKILCLTVILSGCGSLPIPLPDFGGTNSNSGVQVDTEDVVVGKKEEDNDVSTKFGGDKASTQTAETITNIEKGIGLPALLILVLLAGWAIPDPQTMGRGIINFFKTILPWG